MKTTPTMSARRSRTMFRCLLAWFCCLPATAVLHAQTQTVTEAQVNAAIEKAKKALLGKVAFDVEIEYQPSDPNASTKVVRGTIKKDAGGVIELQPASGGQVLTIERKSILRFHSAGLVKEEMGEQFFTGPSALVALALVIAEVPTTEPALAALLETLSSDKQKPVDGVYVRSLRSCLWSLLLTRQISRSNKAKYQRLVVEDVDFLTSSFIPRDDKHGKRTEEDGPLKLPGHHGYTKAGQYEVGDNSNSQFAVLGMWAGSLSKGTVTSAHWQDIESHWLDTQLPHGGWAYRTEGEGATASMTIAGCNSLYIILDRLYSRADAPYKLWEGAAPRKNAREQIAKIYEAIARGDQFLKDHPPDAQQWKGYELLGLERLGIASGQATIGGVDWFKHYAKNACDVEFGQDAIGDSYALIFLVHGQAPILIQKLEHGDSAEQWNYYHRDLHTLFRYLNRTLERLYRWQRIPVDSSLAVMQEAPILYISGQLPLLLPEEAISNIRAYIDWGGTVMLHADLASKEFTNSAKSIFETMFKDRGYKFAKLDAKHPIYSCYFGGADGSQWKEKPPLLGMGDGSRTMVFLFPSDIAGAWHQERAQKHPDLFNIMTNLRTYAAPPFGELHSCLYDRGPAGAPAAARGQLTVGRLKYDGPWNLHPAVWTRYATGLRHRRGIELKVRDGIDPTPEALKDCDIVHLTIHGEPKIEPAARLALENYVKAGGVLLIDAADGQDAGTREVRKFFEKLGIAKKSVIAPRNAIVSGDFPGGSALGELQTTAHGKRLSQGKAPPPILMQESAGKGAVLACPFDLVAGMEGHFVFGRSGYVPESTQRIVDNILAWRLNAVGPAGR